MPKFETSSSLPAGWRSLRTRRDGTALLSGCQADSRLALNGKRTSGTMIPCTHSKDINQR